MVALAGCAAPESRPASGVTVEISGGPNPGSYTGTAPAATCVREPIGPGSLGVQYSDWGGPSNGLRSLQLMLPAESRPREFYLGLAFGDPFSGAVHEIETRAEAPARRGDGAVSVTVSDRETTVTVTGKTADAVAITTRIECRKPAGRKRVGDRR
jgi:hypothetical protein